MSQLYTLSFVATYFGEEDIIRIKKEKSTLYESVNRSIEISDDGITYTITNKENQIGFRKICFQDGNVKTTLNLYKNLRHGNCVEYYPDGNIKLIADYKLDKINGELKAYSPEGKLEKIDSYNPEGNLCRITQYYPNGKVMSISEIKNRKIHGVVKEFFDTGKPHFLRFFEDGIPKGYQYEYHHNGKIKEYILV